MEDQYRLLGLSMTDKAGRIQLVSEIRELARHLEMLSATLLDLVKVLRVEAEAMPDEPYHDHTPH